MIYEQREVGSTMYIITTGEVGIDTMKSRVIEGHTFALPPEDTCWKQFVESSGSQVMTGLPGTTIKLERQSFQRMQSFWGHLHLQISVREYQGNNENHLLHS